MTSYIPLTPQQKRKRRNNILFACASIGTTLVLFAYLFYPASTQEETVTAAPPAQTEQAQEAAGESERRAQTNNPFAADDFLTDTPADAEGEDAAEKATDEPSEEELAKLPPWQAAFARLSKEKRLAFAQAFQNAKNAYASEQWSVCLAQLNDCELIYPDNPNVWNLRACALLSGNELDEAETYIARSLKLNPKDDIALMCEAELFMRRRDFQACIPKLEQLRQLHSNKEDRTLLDTFTFRQLLCHLMLRQKMEARALVADITPMTDSPLYYFSEAAFCVYEGNSQGAMEPLRSATSVYGNNATSSYRKWMNQCGLADKYARDNQP